MKPPHSQPDEPVQTDVARRAPVGNRGAEPAPVPGAYEESPNGDRGDASGTNQEQMDQSRGKPGDSA